LDCVFGNVPFVGSVEAEAMVVQSAGKPRPLTKFSSEALLLKPLHKSLYNHLSSHSWLLRGDVRKDALDAAGFRESRGTLVSGDYASATDNLSIEVAEAILEEARRNSVFVPPSVWDYALRILRPRVGFFDSESGLYERVVVTSGQMMGSFLSFPLLCVQNFLAFRYAQSNYGIRGFLPLLINGDDILFQSTPGFARFWMDTVLSLGLEVEKTKTSVDPSFGSLNSTLLRWKSGRLRVSPVLRFGMLRPRDFLNGLGRDFASFVAGVPPEVAWSAGKEFFKWHVAAIRRSGRLTADEWGFRGRLAWRLATLFSLAPSAHVSVLPPETPSQHNVQIPSGLVESIPRGSAGEELEALNAAEMTCWKWQHEYSRVDGTLRYLVRLSSARAPAEPDVLGGSPASLSVRHRVRLTAPSRSSLHARFFAGAESPRVLVFRELLRMQDFSEFEALPPYCSVELDLRYDQKLESFG
jgi:hypothetical protein